MMEDKKKEFKLTIINEAAKKCANCDETEKVYYRSNIDNKVYCYKCALDMVKYLDI